MSTRTNLLLVFVGGVCGGGLRILVGELVPPQPGIPWEIIAINLVGSAVLGLVVARGQARTAWRYFPLVGPGLLGGFTTFSAMAALSWTSTLDPIAAIALLAATMVACVLAAAGGWSLGWIEAERELASEDDA